MRKASVFYLICFFCVAAVLIFNSYAKIDDHTDLSSVDEELYQPNESFTTGNSTEQDILEFANRSPEIKIFLENVEKIKNGTSAIDSVESFLKNVPAELRNRYALIYHSRSIQGASFLNPRAIVFSEDGDLIYSFNGSKDQSGYNSLEYILFNKTSKEFEFREIDFSELKGHQLKENPNKCLGCHASPDKNNRRELPHPLWDNYLMWPGAYGTIQDAVFSFKTGDMRQTKNAEFQEYEMYLKNATNHPRYSQLLPDKATYNSHGEARPNITLNRAIRDMMGKFIAHQILTNPFIINHLDDFLKYFESFKFAGIYENSEPRFEKNKILMMNLMNISFKSRIQRIQQDFNKDTFPDADPICEQFYCSEKDDGNLEANSLALLQTLMDPAGVNIRSWAIDLYPRTGSLIDGGDGNYFIYLLPAYLSMEACNSDRLINGRENETIRSNINSVRECLKLNKD